MEKIVKFRLLVCLLVLSSLAAAQSPPDWTVNPNQFQFSATITVRVKYNDQAVSSGANLLAAFAGNELRGVASPAIYNGEQIYFLTVYSNNNAEQLIFKEYVALVDTVITLQETQSIVPNGVYGSVSEPLVFHGYYHFDNPPLVSGIPDQIIETGQSFVQFSLDNYLKEVDGNSVVWSYSGNTQLTVSIDSHVVTVTPPTGYWTGSEYIRFRATDVTAAALFTEETVLFQVKAVDHQPKLGSIPVQNAGSNYDFPKIDLRNYLTETDGDNITWSYYFDETSANDPAPTWAVNPGSFSSTMTITAAVTSLGQPGTGGNNLLAAFSNGTVRGLAKPVYYNNKWLYYLTVYANSAGDTITFRFYDAAARKEIPVDQKILFSINGTYGNPGIPFPLYAGNLRPEINADGVLTVQRIDPKWAGTERIVFKAQDAGTIHSYWDTTGTLFTVVDDHTPLVKGIPDQAVQRGIPFTPFAVTAYLTELDGDNVNWSYSGNMHLQVTINANGMVTVTAPDTTWTGSEKIIFRVTDQTANVLFSECTANFAVTPKDHPPHLLTIPNQVTGLGGTFTPVMLPSYLQEVDGDSIVWTFSFGASQVTDPEPQWTVNASAFEHSMTMTVEVKCLNRYCTGTNQKLAAFAGNELRGVASPLDFNGRWIYFLTIYAASDGEQLTFKYYDADVRKIYPVSEKVSFLANAALGEPVSPYQLTAGNLILQINTQNNLVAAIPDTTWYGTEHITVFAMDENTIQHYRDSIKIQFIRMNQVLQSVDAPSGVKALPLKAPLRVELQWKDNSANETGFYIQRKLGDSTAVNVFVTIDSTTANKTTYTDTTIGDSTWYTYKILAFNELLTSSASNQAQVLTFMETPSLSLTALLQGLYSSDADTMIADIVTIQIKDPINLYEVVDSAIGILNTKGKGLFYFPRVSKSTGYYIILRHRNSVETWSAGTISFAGGHAGYDFTTSANKAFGNNMILRGTKWCIYSGDVDQSGFVDNNDLLLVDNDAFNYRTGYAVTDVDGNLFVDFHDLLIVDNNAFNYVGIRSPIRSYKNFMGKDVKIDQ